MCIIKNFLELSWKERHGMLFNDILIYFLKMIFYTQYPANMWLNIFTSLSYQTRANPTSSCLKWVMIFITPTYGYAVMTVRHLSLLRWILCLLRPLWIAFEMTSSFNDMVTGNMHTLNDKAKVDIPMVWRQEFWKHCLPLPQISNQLLATFPFVVPAFESFLTWLVWQLWCTIYPSFNSKVTSKRG